MILFYTISYHILYHNLLYFTKFYDIILEYFISYYIILYDTILNYSNSNYIILCYIIFDYIRLYYIYHHSSTLFQRNYRYFGSKIGTFQLDRPSTNPRRNGAHEAPGHEEDHQHREIPNLSGCKVGM